MNDKQRKLLMGISAIVAALLLFPPYVVAWRGNVLTSGFSFVLNMPKSATVNVPMLFAEMAGVLIIGALLYVLLRDSN